MAANVQGARSAAAAAADSQLTWAEFNAQQKRKAVRWLRSAPRDRLFVGRISMLLSVSLMRLVERVVSQAW